MKVILMMAMTINGKIARPDGSTDWSVEDWQNFLSLAKIIGNAVIGRSTYDVAIREGSMINGVHTVVMTHHPPGPNSDNVTFTNSSPHEVIEMLSSKGYKAVLIAGGGKVNSQFLKEKLIDEIYIDIEPKIFGTGIPLFSVESFETTLLLQKVKKINKNTLSLHYKVVK